VFTIRDAHDVDHDACLSQRSRKVNGYAGIDRMNDLRFWPSVSPSHAAKFSRYRFVAVFGGSPAIHERNS
jgi:hypothetical protein